MGSFSLSAGEIFTPYEYIKDGVITIENGIITDIKKGKTGEMSLDFPSSIIAPGFIDVHTHGIADADVMDASAKSIDKMKEAYASHGVTSFCPTTETAPLNHIEKALNAIKASKNLGAKALGVHLEGPFLSLEKPGAQIVEDIRPPSKEEFDELWNTSERSIKLMTIAPEVPGATKLIRYVSLLGVTVSMGHSNATYDEALAGIRAGVSHTTHLFNGMRAYHHREPGGIGAVLENPNVSVELITDFVHLHPATIQLVYTVKPKNKVIVVTDSIRAADMPDGLYKDRFELYVKDGEARLPNGTLAGSTLTLDKALRNLVFELRVPIKDAMTMITANPAKCIKVDDKIGSIEIGKCADLVVLDRDLNVMRTFIDGEIIFKRKL